MFVSIVELGSAPLTSDGVALAEARGFRRVAAQAEACELAALARYLGSDTSIDDARVLEVAAVFTVSERAARSRMELAVALTTRLQCTWAQLRAGRIDAYKARVIAEATEALTAEQAAAVEVRVLPKAPEQAPARLRDAVRRAVLRVDAAAAEKRRQDTLAHRTVREYPTGDGAGVLDIHGDALRTQAAYHRIRAIAAKLLADGAGEAAPLTSSAAMLRWTCWPAKISTPCEFTCTSRYRPSPPSASTISPATWPDMGM